MAWLISKAMMKECANSPSLRERVAEYSAANSSDGEQSAPSNGTPTQQAFLWQGKTMAAWKRFPSGMMCKHLTEDLGEDLLMWYREDFLAKTLVLETLTERELKGSDLECGAKWCESFATLNQSGSSWRTHQCSLFVELEESFVIWPEAGMMQGGVCWEQKMSAHHTKEKEFGSWATPQASDQRRVISTFGSTLRNRKNIPELGTEKGWINPELSEWLMGWPTKWTDLKPLETDKFQEWRQLHGEFSEESK
jgi:hypothetical protein